MRWGGGGAVFSHILAYSRNKLHCFLHIGMPVSCLRLEFTTFCFFHVHCFVWFSALFHKLSTGKGIFVNGLDVLRFDINHFWL